MIFFTNKTPIKGAWKNIFYIFSLTFLLLINASYQAVAKDKQNPNAFEVSGSVTSETGEALVGVTVSEKGTTNGVSTDVNGRFKLNLRDGNATLLVRYIGYQTKEVPVNNNAALNIKLAADQRTLNEVVVVAYGSQRKGDITGSVTTIKADDVRDQPVTQFTQSIQGKTPGVQVNQTTGIPGQGMAIRVRGAISFNANSQPLYVVDGVPLISDINNINPDEIETFTVLKDASSTALYGSRAANGVIIITTKHAKAGQNSLTFNSFYGVQTVPQKGRPDVMNAVEFAQYEQDVFKEQDRINRANGGAGVALPVEYQNPSQYAGKGTDWYNVLLRNAPIQSYNLALNSGTEKSTTTATMGMLNQDGVLIASNYKRYSVRVNSEYKFNSKITVGLNVAPTYEKQANGNTDGNIFGGGIIQNAITSSPISPYKNADGSLPLTSQSPGLFGNPNWYRVATENKNNTQKGRLLSNAYANIEIIKDLNFRTSLNIDYVNEQNQTWSPSTSGGLFAPPPNQASATSTSNIYSSWLAENTLNYKRSFGNHNFDVLVGYTAQKYRQDYSYLFGYGFPSDRISSLAAATQFGTPVTRIQEWSLASFVSRLNYNYKNKYLLSASFRRDGSSRFGPNVKYGNFPAVSAGWNVSEESFMQKFPIISDLKLRAAYGLNGNFNIGNYGFIPNTQTTNYTFNGVLTPGTSIGNIGNSNLTWEKSRQLDLGVDFSLLKGRISFTYDYFNKITSALLFQINVPRESGFSSISDNIGKVRFRGHEFAINTQNLVGPNLRWSTNFNISFVRSKILDLGPYGVNLPRDGNGANINMIGQPVGMFYGYKFIGVYKDQQDFDSSPKYTGSDSPSQIGTVKYADINGDKIIDSKDKTIIGNPNPDFTYGMTNNLYYKKFDFGVTISGAYGGDLQNRTLEYTQNLDGVFNVTKDVARRWKSPTDQGDGVHPRIVVGTALARNTNSRWVSDGSFLTVKNVTLGYAIPLKANNYIKSVRVYTSAQQLIVFTKYKGANPEVSGVEGSSIVNIGIDNTSYPVPRTISFGVNVNLK